MYLTATFEEVKLPARMFQSKTLSEAYKLEDSGPTLRL
jgi:hypothetical protein